VPLPPGHPNSMNNNNFYGKNQYYQQRELQQQPYNPNHGGVRSAADQHYQRPPPGQPGNISGPSQSPNDHQQPQHQQQQRQPGPGEETSAWDYRSYYGAGADAGGFNWWG